MRRDFVNQRRFVFGGTSFAFFLVCLYGGVSVKPLETRSLDYLSVAECFSQLASLYKQKGHPFKTSLNTEFETRRFFAGLTKEQLEIAFDNISRQVDLISSDGFSFDDDRQTVSCFCEVNGLAEPTDFYEVMKKEDIIEIYDKNYIQRYHNFVIDKISSYMPEDLLSHPSYELYSRAKRVYDEVLGLSDQILRGEVTGLVKSGTGPHLMKEVKSAQKRAFTVEFKYMRGLVSRTSGLTKMIIVSQSAKRVQYAEANLAGFI